MAIRSGDGLTTVEPQLDDPLLDDGDHDRFSHYARKSDIVESAVTGKPIVALCGKVWVPGRDPARYPVCPTCKEVYEQKKVEESGACPAPLADHGDDPDATGRGAPASARA